MKTFSAEARDAPAISATMQGGAAGPSTRTRLDLAAAVQKSAPLSRRQSAKLVQMVIDEIVETLAAGEEVKLSGFGVFQIRSKAERLGRNPKNGEPAPISRRRVVVFRASRLLKARVSGSKTVAGEHDADRDEVNPAA